MCDLAPAWRRVLLEGRLQPARKRVALRPRQPPARVNQLVLQRRHLTAVDGIDDLTEVWLSLVPVRDVEAGATVFDVVLHEPRGGRDLVVPAPVGEVAVAVLARAAEELGRLRAVPLDRPRRA